MNAACHSHGETSIPRRRQELDRSAESHFNQAQSSHCAVTPTVGPGTRSWTFKFHFQGDLLCLNVQQMMRIDRAVFQDQAPNAGPFGAPGGTAQAVWPPISANPMSRGRGRGPQWRPRPRQMRDRGPRATLKPGAGAGCHTVRSTRTRSPPRPATVGRGRSSGSLSATGSGRGRLMYFVFTVSRLQFKLRSSPACPPATGE